MAYIGSKPADKPVVASDLDPTIITGQTALATAPADTDEFIISDAGVLKRIDASLVIPSVANTPAFLAYVNSTQSIANNTAVIITNYGAEVFDTHNAFASSTFTVPSGGAGKYFFVGSVSTSVSSANTANQFNLQIKTGSTSLGSVTILRPPYAKLQCSGMADLSVGHTVTMQIYQDSGSAVTIDGDRKVFFTGFKLIT